VSVYRSEKKRVTLCLPGGRDATIKDLIRTLNSVDEQPYKTVTIFDLSPYDESKLGRDPRSHGRGGMCLKVKNKDEPEPAWVSQSNPKPVNCRWKPSLEDPDQKLSAAGLCDGAELEVLEISRTIG